MIDLARVRELARTPKLVPVQPQAKESPNVPKLVKVKAIKVNVVFRQGELPAIDPNNPEFTVMLGEGEPGLRDGQARFTVPCKVSAKAARKLAGWQGGAVLQGRMTIEGNRLAIVDAGFAWIDPKPADPAPEGTGGTS